MDGVAISNDEIEFTPINVEDYYGQTVNEKTGAFPSGVNGPVLRLWGPRRCAGPQKQTICCHVHGFYPYMYLRPCLNRNAPDLIDRFDRDESWRREKVYKALATDLEKLLKAKKPNDQASRLFNTKEVHLTPVYGYHTSSSPFARLEFRNAKDVRVAATLLLTHGIQLDGICIPFQAYESHVSYMMKFFIDFGLFGLQSLRCQKYTIRQNQPRSLACLEIDVMATDIHTVVKEHIEDDAVPELTALPSLRQLFVEEARILRADGVKDVKAKLSIDSEWLSPSDHSDSKCSQYQAQQRWAQQLDKLRHYFDTDQSESKLNSKKITDPPHTAEDSLTPMHKSSTGLPFSSSEWAPKTPAILPSQASSTRSLLPKLLWPQTAPPSALRLWQEYGSTRWFYSDPNDIPKKMLYGGTTNRAAMNSTVHNLPRLHLPVWDGLCRRLRTKKRPRSKGTILLAPTSLPPSPRIVQAWCQQKANTDPHRTRAASLLKWPTPPQRTQATTNSGSAARDKRGLRENSKFEIEQVQISLLAIEVLAPTNMLRSDPGKDPVTAIAWRFRDHYDDDAELDTCGLISITQEEESFIHISKDDIEVLQVSSETELILACCKICAERFDPELLMGWDTERESIAYLTDRGALLNIDVPQLLSRVDRVSRRSLEYRVDAYLERGVPGLQVRGRICLNGWREVSRDDFAKMRSYTLEAALETICKQTLPTYNSLDKLTPQAAISYLYRRCAAALMVLTELNTLGRAAELARLFGMPLADALSRGSQHRVEAVILRLAKPRPPGENPLRRAYSSGESGYPWYAFLSPTRLSVNNQAALQEVALTLEPSSYIYEDPMVVVDFRSLYPSMIIAYNMCFSTLICSLRRPRNYDYEKGLTTDACRLLRKPPGYSNGNIPRYRPAYIDNEDDYNEADADYGLEATSDGDEEKNGVHIPTMTTTNESVPAYERLGVAGYRSIHQSYDALRDAESCGCPAFVAPNGVVFAPRAKREGLLPRALREILAARVAVKAAMKRAAKKRRGTRVRILDARQLALKLLANVTYGYCSASFSGRMPCAELADAIVASGRETLLAAIAQTEKQLCYGDTDSLFVLRPGESVSEAIRWGQEFARRVTAQEPPAVGLKFEYVLFPAVLVAKKRYAGIAYEDAKTKGHWLCKGLECMRRDQCDFVAMTMEKVLRILFESWDVSKAKEAFLRSVEAASAGAMPWQYFIMRQQAKLGLYKRPDKTQVANVATALNRRGARILLFERVAYLYHAVTQDTCRYESVTDAHDAVHNFESNILNIEGQYVNRMLVPALQRVLGTIGVDMEHWCKAITWRQAPLALGPHGNQPRISEFMKSTNCLACGQSAPLQSRRKGFSTDPPWICSACLTWPDAALLEHRLKATRLEHADSRLRLRCHDCVSYDYCTKTFKPSLALPSVERPCDSLDCPIAYLRRSLQADLRRTQVRVEQISKAFEERRYRLHLEYE